MGRLRGRLCVAQRKEQHSVAFFILLGCAAFAFAAFMAGAFPNQPLSRMHGAGSARALTEETDCVTTAARIDNLVPPSYFTCAQKRNGAIVLHMLLLVYMFAALAIVCDEYFIPALEVLVEELRLSEEVAGATFMEAGTSAPQLVTSLLGVFVFRSDVGVGTIVGSGAFNCIFVVGVLCLYSATSGRAAKLLVGHGDDDDDDAKRTVAAASTAASRDGAADASVSHARAAATSSVGSAQSHGSSGADWAAMRAAVIEAGLRASDDSQFSAGASRARPAADSARATDAGAPNSWRARAREIDALIAPPVCISLSPSACIRECVCCAAALALVAATLSDSVAGLAESVALLAFYAVYVIGIVVEDRALALGDRLTVRARAWVRMWRAGGVAAERALHTARLGEAEAGELSFVPVSRGPDGCACASGGAGASTGARASAGPPARAGGTCASGRRSQPRFGDGRRKSSRGGGGGGSGAGSYRDLVFGTSTSSFSSLGSVALAALSMAPRNSTTDSNHGTEGGVGGGDRPARAGDAPSDATQRIAKRLAANAAAKAQAARRLPFPEGASGVAHAADGTLVGGPGATPTPAPMRQLPSGLPPASPQPPPSPPRPTPPPSVGSPNTHALLAAAARAALAARSRARGAVMPPEEAPPALPPPTPPLASPPGAPAAASSAAGGVQLSARTEHFNFGARRAAGKPSCSHRDGARALGTPGGIGVCVPTGVAGSASAGRAPPAAHRGDSPPRAPHAPQPTAPRADDDGDGARARDGHTSDSPPQPTKRATSPSAWLKPRLPHLPRVRMPPVSASLLAGHSSSARNSAGACADVGGAGASGGARTDGADGSTLASCILALSDGRSSPPRGGSALGADDVAAGVEAAGLPFASARMTPRLVTRSMRYSEPSAPDSSRGGGGGGAGGLRAQLPRASLVRLSELSEAGARSLASERASARSWDDGSDDGGGDGAWRRAWRRAPQLGLTLQRAWLALSFPVALALFLTVPHCKDEGRRWAWPITFGLSIVWICAFSYTIVWMALECAWTFGIPDNLVGVTVVAVGVTLPDALAALAVAKQGYGQMAYASAIGSCIFDITVGLPLPWVFYLALKEQIGHGNDVVVVTSKNIWLQVLALLGMLLLQLKAVHSWHWSLTWELAVPLFAMYFVFITEALALDFIEFRFQSF